MANGKIARRLGWDNFLGVNHYGGEFYWKQRDSGLVYAITLEDTQAKDWIVVLPEHLHWTPASVKNCG